MEFLQKLQKHISDKQLFDIGQKLLLAVSGGVDSVVLLHSLLKLGFNISVAHCNFQLRGTESELDEEFVKELAKAQEIQFFSAKFDCQRQRDLYGGSVQMAARELRYNWFEKVRKENELDFILTAHHQNDALETILLNIVRGTGISGLSGIADKRGSLIRPLLFATREEINQFAQIEKLTWREDLSNISDKYARNLIRNNIIPVLKQLNPSLENTVRHSTELIRLSEKFIQNQLKLIETNIITKEGTYYKISINDLLLQEDPLFVLSGLLSRFNFHYDVIKRVFNSHKAVSGKLFYSGSHRLLKDRSCWIIDMRRPATDYCFTVKSDQTSLKIESGYFLKFEVVKSEPASVELLKKENILVLDYDKLVFPLIIRKWKNGDLFHPVGLKGTKKVSDFLTDLKMNLFDKEKLLVLESNDKVAGVFDHYPSRYFAAGTNTTSFYMIKILKTN